MVAHVEWNCSRLITYYKVRGRDDLAQQSYYSGATARRRDPMLIEALVRAPRSMAAAPDYKFFVFGGQVAAVFYVQGRHTREECSAWYVPRKMPPAERLLSHYTIAC